MLIRYLRVYDKFKQVSSYALSASETDFISDVWTIQNSEGNLYRTSDTRVGYLPIK